ncbi:GNAT family N-acetyltransferase [Dermabacter hominis]|uniref:GNAT family N-acetyltransferase n=1 Tax=Dermabacter hominis TaxID=36740 RepID=UPI0007742257|nr:GNAT family N-acetyltransferase [Dermabacter hominis]
MLFMVRHARPSETFALSELAARTFPLACPPTLARAHIDAHIRENLSPKHFDAHIAHPDHDVLVAAVGPEILGYALALFGPDGSPAPGLGVTLNPAGLLSKCYTDPKVHGTKAGASLLVAAEERARERGVNGLWLNTNAHNIRAQRFYRKHGFSRVGDIDLVVGGIVHHDPVFEKRV